MKVFYYLYLYNKFPKYCRSIFNYSEPNWERSRSMVEHFIVLSYRQFNERNHNKLEFLNKSKQHFVLI